MGVGSHAFGLGLGLGCFLMSGARGAKQKPDSGNLGFCSVKTPLAFLSAVFIAVLARGTFTVCLALFVGCSRYKGALQVWWVWSLSVPQQSGCK